MLYLAHVPGATFPFIASTVVVLNPSHLLGSFISVSGLSEKAAPGCTMLTPRRPTSTARVRGACSEISGSVFYGSCAFPNGSEGCTFLVEPKPPFWSRHDGLGSHTMDCHHERATRNVKVQDYHYGSMTLPKACSTSTNVRARSGAGEPPPFHRTTRGS